MSMNFSEFKRLLGADPRSRDPELQRARHSSPEFEQAATRAEKFETILERSASIPAPDGLMEDIKAISQQQAVSTKSKGWRRMALAASVLIAVGAAGLTWKMNPQWDSVEDYLAYHYNLVVQLTNVDNQIIIGHRNDCLIDECRNEFSITHCVDESAFVIP